MAVGRERKVLLTGVTGQDGVYLARRLRALGAGVVGTAAPRSADQSRAATYLAGVEVVALDVRDGDQLRAVVAKVEPDEVYNLAAVSSVARSWQEPEETVAVNQTAVEIIVDALLALRDTTGRDVRFFQASSAEVEGPAAGSPYATAKAAAEEVVREARERRGLHACFARLHNHESPLRTVSFVTRKITRAAAEIALGVRTEVRLGNLDVQRDWGFAGDHVDAITRMVARDEPVDLPIGTGVPHRLADLLETAFRAAGVDDAWSHVLHDPALVRPVDAAVLLADPEPAAAAIGWRAGTTFEELVEHMVAVDLERVRSGVEDDERYLFR